MNSKKLITFFLLSSFIIPSQIFAANGGHVMPKSKKKEIPEKVIGPLTASLNETCSLDDINKYHLLTEYKSGNNTPQALASFMVMGLIDLNKFKRRIALIKQKRFGPTEDGTNVTHKLEVLEKIVDAKIDSDTRQVKATDRFVRAYAQQVADWLNEPKTLELIKKLQAENPQTSPQRVQSLASVELFKQNSTRFTKIYENAVKAAQAADPTFRFDIEDFKSKVLAYGGQANLGSIHTAIASISGIYSNQFTKGLESTYVNNRNVLESESLLIKRLAASNGLYSREVIFNDGKYTLGPIDTYELQRREAPIELLRSKVNLLISEGSNESVQATNGYRRMHDRLALYHKVYADKNFPAEGYKSKEVFKNNGGVRAVNMKDLMSNPEASEARNGKFTNRAIKSTAAIGVLGVVSQNALATAEEKKYEQFLIGCGVSPEEARNLKSYIRRDTVAVDALHKNTDQCDKVTFNPDVTPLDLAVPFDNGAIELQGSACLILKKRNAEMEMAVKKEPVIQIPEGKGACEMSIGSSQNSIGRFIKVDGIDHFETAYSGKEIGVRLPIKKAQGMARFDLENVRCIRDIGDGKTQEVPTCQSFMNALWAETDGVAFHMPNPKLAREKFYQKGKQVIDNSNAEAFTRGLGLVQNNMGEVLTSMSDLNLIGCFDTKATPAKASSEVKKDQGR